VLPIHINKVEQDFGACLKAVCPHCQKESEFRLRMRSGALRLFGFVVADLGGCYCLKCNGNGCKFWKDLEDGELAAAQTAVCLYREMVADELSADAYAKSLDALDFPTIHALRKEAATWSCPVCGEKVPLTMNGCWKCSSPRPGLAKSESAASEDRPPIPYAATRPSNPWEQ
jgi:hypothetical protein